MKYRAEIDGLRALAIIPVVFFHGGFSLVSGGYVGVDVFFVISGYLITSIIYSDIHTNSFSFAQFYEKRIKRLFPALFVVISCCSLIAWHFYEPYDLEDFSGNLASVFAFLSNLHFYHNSGYFSPSSELNVLLHTWSLSVEEQFYFLFPWFLLLINRFGKKWIYGGIIAVAVISICLAEWRLQTKPMAAFYLIYARAWELMIGSLCAIYMFNNPKPQFSRNTSSWLAGIGLVLIFGAIFLFDSTTPAAGVYTLIPTLGAALIILFGSTDNFVGKMLSVKWLVFIGLLSYSTYLWHQPLLAFARYYFHGELDTYLSLFLCLMSFAMGYCSWRFVEKPFRYGRLNISNRRSVFGVFTGLSLVVIFSGSYVKNERGFPERLDSNVRDIYQTEGKYLQVEECFLTELDEFHSNTCIQSKNHLKNALIIGDSHAASLFPSLLKRMNDNGWTLSMLTYARCVPIIDEKYLQDYRDDSRFLSKHITPRCDKVKDSFRKQTESKDFDLVIVLNHYHNWVGSYNSDNFSGFWDMYVDSLISKFGKEKLLVLGPLPVWEDDLPKLIVKDYAAGNDYLGPSFIGLYDRDRQLDSFANSDLTQKGVRYLSSMDGLCTEAGCKRTGELANGAKIALSYDYAHLSSAGADVLSTFIVNSIDIAHN